MMTVTYSVQPMGALTAAAGVAMPTAAPALVPNPVNIVRSSRVPPDDTSGRWVNGFSYVPEGVGILGLAQTCGGFPFATVSDTDSVDSDWTPYVLVAQYQCSTFGFADADYAGRARRFLDAATPKLLEEEFWTGALNTAASLGNTALETATVTPQTANNVQKAVGLLEQSLGDCNAGGRGMIHCPPYATPFMGTFVRREGNLLLTNRDTIVVPGSGYSSVASVGTSFNMYATGITEVRLTDIQIEGGEQAEYIDRSTNMVNVFATRVGCVSWDELCLAKVTVTLT